MNIEPTPKTTKEGFQSPIWHTARNPHQKLPRLRRNPDALCSIRGEADNRSTKREGESVQGWCLTCESILSPLRALTRD